MCFSAMQCCFVDPRFTCPGQCLLMCNVVLLVPPPAEQDGAQLQQEVSRRQEDCGAGVNRETYRLDDQAKLITVEEVCLSLDV